MYILRVVRGKESLVSSILMKYGVEVKPSFEKGFVACKIKPSFELMNKLEDYILEVVESNDGEVEIILNKREDKGLKIKEGMVVEIISGIYEGFSGIVRRIEDEIALVDLNLFGKTVPVEIFLSEMRIPADPWS